MKKNILIISVAVFVLWAKGFLFGVEEKKTLSFEERHKDKEAIFLFYEVAIKLNEDWSYTTKVHKKLKILKEEARDWGEVPVPYEKGREKIAEVKACTITPDGKKHRYSKVQDFKVFKAFPMYSDSMVKVITLPEVNIGSILEYKATVISKGLPIKGAFWHMADFNFSLPVKEMNFTITIPKKLGINYKEFNLDYKPEIREDGFNTTYSWHLKEIDDYKETEDYLPPPNLENIGDAFEFSSIKKWSDISSWYSLLIEKNLKINDAIEEAAKKALKGKVTIKDKVRAILEYIQDNFRYVSMSFGDNTLEPHPTDEVFQNKYGDCKDLSLLCLAMLKVGGIKSHIALFNTEFSITDPKYDLAIPSLFDHVLLFVEDPKEGDFYIDPLLDGYDIGQYPSNYQAAYTFIITENGGGFGRLPIFNEKRNYHKAEQTITIGQDGSALTAGQLTMDLDTSVEFRDKFNALDKEGKERFYQALDTIITSGGEMLERRIEGLDEKYGLLKGYAKFRRKDAYPVTDDMIIIELEGYERNADFTEKERKNPIFCPVNSLSEEITTYHIPQGFRISYIPKNINLNTEFLNIKREYVRNQNEIIVTTITRYKRLELSKENYAKVKDFFNQLPTKAKQRIMLKRIKPWWQGIKDIAARFKR